MLGFLVNPNKFNRFTDFVLKPVSLLSLIVLLVGLILIYFSPDDYQQGSTVKIMYIHVPSAWLSLLTYFLMTIYSIVGLTFRMPFGFIFNTAVAPIGAIFTLICLVSGSLWGKPMWGTWWVWDARLTSVFILFFFYVGFIIFSKSFNDPSKGDKISSVLALVGFINIPIIKFSVDFWTTLHQPASISKLGSPSIHSEMLIPLMIMFLSFMLLFIYIFSKRFIAELNLRRFVAYTLNSK